MLYISFGLILAGVMVIVYSVARNSSHSGMEKSEPGEAIILNEFNSGNNPENNLRIYREADNNEEILGSSAGSDQGKALSADDQDQKDTVALYEDDSGAVNYSRGHSPESDIDTYTKIKRIGVGKITLDHSGVNFRSGRRFFRFDYSRISSIETGGNFAALAIAGTRSVRLFVFHPGSEQINVIKSAYESFKK